MSIANHSNRYFTINMVSVATVIQLWVIINRRGMKGAEVYFPLKSLNSLWAVQNLTCNLLSKLLILTFTPSGL